MHLHLLSKVPLRRAPQVYLANWKRTPVAVKVLVGQSRVRQAAPLEPDIQTIQKLGAVRDKQLVGMDTHEE